MELRCENGIKFGEADNGIVEVKCRSSRCGHQPGVVVLHRFDAMTGDLVDTRRFKDPAFRKEARDASLRGPAVRHP